jgi:membrane-associated phospholipid phosphatase
MSTADAQAEPFFHWPGWGRLGYFARLALAVGAWFSAVFYGADALTALHPYRVRVHLEAELQMPFVPAAVLGYLSLYLPLWGAAFILRSRRELRALAVTLAAVILIAGVCFLVLPADNALPPPPEDLGVWTGLVHGAKQIALEHNMLPSLHVALSVVCLAIYARRARPLGRLLLWLWASVISLSTLLLHQHYLLDVAAGFALGLAGVYLVYDRSRSRHRVGALRRPS